MTRRPVPVMPQPVDEPCADFSARRVKCALRAFAASFARTSNARVRSGPPDTRWSEVLCAPEGIRTPNLLIRSYDPVNGMLTCGKAGRGRAVSDRLDAACPILF